MSEAKRVPLQTLEFPESLGHATKKEKKGNVGKQLAPSFRFTLTLPESNEKTCPEFNYAQLLKTAEVSSVRLTRFCRGEKGDRETVCQSPVTRGTYIREEGEGQRVYLSTDYIADNSSCRKEREILAAFPQITSTN